MARKAGIWYRSEQGAYFTTISGVQTLLARGPDDKPTGPIFKAAQAAFDVKMEQAEAVKTGRGYSVRALLSVYLDALQEDGSPHTFAKNKGYLDRFSAAFGERYAESITPQDVQAFLDSMTSKRRYEKTSGKAGKYAKRSALSALRSLYRWGCQTQRIARNPAAGMALVKPRSRSVECVLSADDVKRVMAAATRSVRRFLTLLEATGCRPGELCAVSAKDVDWQRRAIVFYPADRAEDGAFRHKTSRRGVTRTILLDDASLSILRQLADRYPTGPLFRTRYGTAYTSSSFACTVRRMRKRLDMPHLIPYCFRHTYATRWIAAGGSIDLLAVQLGNTPDVIRRHYSHLLSDWSALRSAVDAFRKGPETVQEGGK